MKKIFLLIVISIISITTFAQITVSNVTGQTPQQLILNELAGEGVTLTNGQFNRSANAITSQKIGTFTNGTGFPDFPISNGIIMTTGNISVAVGPNNSSSKSVAIDDNVAIDSDLQSIASSSLTGATILEFDFEAVSPTFEFEYIFASEEYPEYVCSQYNDIFAFFLTGLDPVTLTTTTKNIALIPNTNIVVAINSVNGYPAGTSYPASSCIATNYTQFYNSVPSNSPKMQFDGYTVMRSNGQIASGLIASARISPCRPYHMKLSIANAGDSGYDSGVFLKQGSFTSPKLETKTTYTESSNDTLITGCNTATMAIGMTADDTCTRPYNITLNTQALAGITATIGDDFQIFCLDDQGNITSEITSDSYDFSLHIGDRNQKFLVKVSDNATFPENDIRVAKILIQKEMCPDKYEYDTLILNLKNHKNIILEAPEVLDFCDVCNEIGVIVAQGEVNEITWIPDHNIDHNDQITTSANITQTTTYQIIATDSYRCKYDTLEMEVNITSEPTVNFHANATVGCAPFTVQFTSTTTPQNAPLTWVINNTDTILDETQFDYTFDTPGLYTVALYSNLSEDCGSELVREDYILVGDYPHADFTWSPDIPNNGRMVSFANLSTGDNITNYHWSFGDGSISNESDPAHAYHVNSDRSFNIMLTVTNNAGCSDDTLQTINVVDNYAFYVPNSFSPNSDGNNDLFQVFVTDVLKYHITIYNRFGEAVFQSVDPNATWDGTYKGEVCQGGVYTYKISYIKYANVETELYKTGTITIIR